MTATPGFGDLLKRLRHARGLSQLALAANAAVSPRHLSFLESGRAKPSEVMVSRLASALELDPTDFDDLRTAAGFCARNAERGPSIGDRIFESALMMEGAHTAAQIVDAGRAILPEFGIGQFFFGTLAGESSAMPGFDWANFGAFPTSWLHFYDRERYAMTDPLLAVVRARSDSFFWDEVIDRRTLAGPAREMFERAEAGGVSSGFVVSRRREGSIQIASMMGARVDRRSRLARVALEMLGSRMLVDLDRLGALPHSRRTDV
ncbi:MAG: autoinducer binding domain-containing protein [Betaproteobacteria bacterium]